MMYSRREVVMGRGTRFTAEEQARIVELSAQGVPGRLIARELGRSSHGAVGWYGMKLRQPPPRPRRRARGGLSLAERGEISRGVGGGESSRVLARRLSRAPSTISRKVT